MSGFGGFGSTTGTGGAFGNPPQQQQQQQTGSGGGGLFGGFGTQGTNQTAGTGGGLFGASQQPQQPAGGGLFGSTTTQPQAGGLFGNNNAQSTAGTAPNASAPNNFFSQPAGSGLFGNTNTNTATNNAGAATNTGGGLFGSTAGTGTGGLFGSTTNNTTPSGGLFGATPGATTGGGLFGGPTTNTTAPSSGLFGGTNPAANTTTGGLFGSTTAPAGGLFGSTNASTQPSGGLFGSTQPNTNNNQSSLFGSTMQPQANTGGLFGQSTQPQANAPAGSLFGSLAQPQKSNGLMGGSTLLGSTNNLFASKNVGGANQQQADAQSQSQALVQRIEAVYNAWNPTSPQCRFQHVFYNLVDPAQVQLYGRPPNAHNDAMWQKAVRENPNPNCHVPVIATSFDDVQQRVEAQSKQAASHQEKLKELRTRITALSQRHQLSNASRLQRAAALQTQLTHRVLKLVQHLHLLIPALRSSAIRPEEEALRTALEQIDEEVRRPGGAGRIRGKLNELWALAGALSAPKERRQGGVEWTVVDEDGLAQITKILAEEQAGLAHLTNLLQKDMKDLSVILGTNVPSDDMDVSSSTALRGSRAF